MSKRPPVLDFAAWEAQIDRVIASRFTASFMSNAKWQRLFAVVGQPQLGIHQAVWKFVDRQSPFRFRLPSSRDIENALFSEPAGESPFKRIEWLEITNLEIPTGWEAIPHKHRPQDIEGAIVLLNAVGQFELERTETGVRVYGYR